MTRSIPLLIVLVTALPSAVVLAAEAVVSDSIPVSGVSTLVERLGIPLSAAVLSTWLAYQLASKVINRAWEIEDEHRRQAPIATQRYEELLAEHIRCTTAVIDAMKKCPGVQSQRAAER